MDRFGSVPGKEVSSKGGPLDDALPTKQVKASSTRENLAPKSSSLVPIKPLYISCSGAGSNNPAIQEKNSPMIISNFQKSPPNGPAVKVIWKGSFEILDIAKVPGIAPDLKICEGFLAHPPTKVSRKSYNFSKQMAGVIQFKLHPRGDFWPEIFQIDSPDANDIALYFYPGNFESSKRKYSVLLKYIEKNDLVLRSHMGLVELLVFASKLLPLDFQKLNGSFFMWGVFRLL